MHGAISRRYHHRPKHCLVDQKGIAGYILLIYSAQFYLSAGAMRAAMLAEHYCQAPNTYEHADA